MRDSVSGVKGMSPHRPLKNGHFCCRTCLSSCQMCNLGWLHSPPTWPLLDVKREVFSLSLMFHLLKMRFILICARPLRVRVLCVCVFSAHARSLSLSGLWAWLQKCYATVSKGKKKIRNRLIYSLLLVEVEQIGQWEELEPPAVLLVLWSTQLSHVFHVSSTQREIWQLLLQHWYSEARAS